MFRSLVVALGLVCCTQGCTLAGGAVGSAVPEYTPASVSDARDGAVDRGERVAVVRDSDGEKFVGKFRGVDALGLEVETDSDLVTIPTSDVRGVSVARQSHWLEGAMLGLAADVAVVVIVGTRISRAYPDTSGIGNIHIGSDGVTVGAR